MADFLQIITQAVLTATPRERPPLGLWVLAKLPLRSFCSRRLISFALGVRNDVAFRCTTLTAEGHGRTNPFASATKIALARALFVSSKEIRLHLCHRQHCCRTLCCMIRFACNWKNKHECFRFAFLPSLADCLAGACISHAPAKMPFEVFFCCRYKQSKQFK